MRLNLGAGARPMQGADWVNIDIQERMKPDLVCDVTKGLPYPDDSVDEVRAQDFLEHVPRDKQIFVMNEIWRVLKRGGVFISSTPDAEYGQGAFQDPTHLSFWTENTWLYFSHPAYRELYDIRANFLIEALQRHCTDTRSRVFHINVMARAIKE